MQRLDNRSGHAEAKCSRSLGLFGSVSGTSLGRRRTLTLVLIVSLEVLVSVVVAVVVASVAASMLELVHLLRASSKVLLTLVTVIPHWHFMIVLAFHQ